ncbi:major facilitator superfamily domain-containing protein [Massariosphaeria phaeospora]|uniref:Major facilitator superfamily domain-containing protein n=1 Tax=Massariosphaeria phaeospora TaxID=100035 RepID=A0A7C8IAP2_9PLEO|nr:major facilitator superfamily domain-containing protein [Massariosphaeria phaeospora]
MADSASAASASVDTPAPPATNSKDIGTNRGWRFWAIFPALCVTALLSSIEATVVSNALSTITAELDLGDNYPWVVNSFLLTSTAAQPIFGQLADFWGRRWVTMSAVALLVFGSGISGGASNGSMLIAGRAIMGIGGGGINMLIELIVCDLVPLRERPKFLGLVAIIFALGTGMGPFIGGALVQHSSWRWIFYMNIPIGGTAIVLLFLFLHVNTKRTSFKDTLGRFDYIGSVLVLSSTVAIIFALTYGGARHPWSSWRVIVPIVLGIVGIIAFHAWEASSWVKQPLIPPHLFGNRTSAISFYATFVQALLFVWVIYFLPVYFQAVLGSSATRAGVQLLPTVTGIIPFAGVGAAFVEKVGRYKPVHFAGLALMAIGTGTFTLLDESSSTGMWVGLQLLQVAGFAAITTALLPAVQAPLSDKDNATSTAAWAYIRSYGAVWGITIPVAVFNTQFDRRLHEISDPAIRSVFAGGNAYAHGTKEFMSQLSPESRVEVVGVFVQVLKVVWIVAAAICAASTLLVFLEKEIPLRTELDSDEFGYKEKKKESDNEKAGDAAK